MTTFDAQSRHPASMALAVVYNGVRARLELPSLSVTASPCKTHLHLGSHQAATHRLIHVTVDLAYHAAGVDP